MSYGILRKNQQGAALTGRDLVRHKLEAVDLPQSFQKRRQLMVRVPSARIDRLIFLSLVKSYLYGVIYEIALYDS